MRAFTPKKGKRKEKVLRVRYHVPGEEKEGKQKSGKKNIYGTCGRGPAAWEELSMTTRPSWSAALHAIDTYGSDSGPMPVLVPITAESCNKSDGEWPCWEPDTTARDDLVEDCN